ncbi:P pilus assembly protein, chaperone PapD [Anabaena sp. FACHB-1237]|uniref:P pilus assembly protein, chaperone PapD n=1 Tax=Anabaena sp. FACHB-1237 TaxID=2692769 RepID=UPI001680FE2C|nr:P pilus assembly protein, chaperone PapD [Anabaena sp. FACHB-1237]MBD2139475.1 P pilus assembly protein, chaperone PapD [Anabaena sp. FACHB-1237]
MKRTIAKILPLFCWFTLGFTPMVAYGQLSVFPLTIQRQAQSGQARGVINIFNNSNKPYQARVSSSPFTYNREGLQVLQSSPNDLTPYLTFSPRELVIAPGQKRSIRFNARLLPSLPQGEYRAMFSVEELEDNSSNSGGNLQNQVSITVNIAATIYVINGDFFPKLAVKKAFYDGNKKQIKLLVDNTGEATTRAKTEWNLSQDGKTVNSGKVEETTVIAKGERYIEISYLLPQGETLTPGNYQLSGKLFWNAKKPENLPFNVNFTVSPEDIKK